MTGENFCHLHNHSYYSLLDGLSSTKDLVDTASELGFKSLALTDHGTCSGLYRFQKDCKAKGIKPILGMEAYITDDHKNKHKDSKTYHLIIIAKNKIGYKNLIYLSSFGYIHGFYKKPRIDFAVLEAHKEGLIISSACPSSELARGLWDSGSKKVNVSKTAWDVINRYKDVFGEDYYLEVMSHSYCDHDPQEDKEKKLSGAIYQMAKKEGIKCICTQDVHYARPNEWKVHDTLLSIQMHNIVKDPDRFTFNSHDFYMKSQEAMQSIFSNAPELLLNTVEISEKCEEDLIVPDTDLLPRFDFPPELKSEEYYLKELVKDGMQAMGLLNKPEYRERIKYEINTIIKCGYTRYILILWDVINFARMQKIRVGPGRGCFLPDNIVKCDDGMKRIQNVNKGDRVLSYDGKYHEVTDIMSYDVEEEMVEIEMEDGRKISCTKDHEIHVERDGKLTWVCSNELTEEDIIYDIQDTVMDI